MNTTPAPRPQFSSRLVTVLTMAGVAIGLGNIWRFPYMMGANGGSAFLLTYLLFMLLLAVPAMLAEWQLGRVTRLGPIGAFKAAFGPRLGTLIGYAILINMVILVSYYLLIIGGVVLSTFWAALRGFADDQMAAYASTMQHSGLQYGIALGLLVASMLVLARGLHGGIETASRFIVPLFLLAAILLAVRALMLPDAFSALAEYLRPDFTALTPGVLFAALGQVCFSVGLGGAAFVIYGSYLRDDDSLVGEATATAGLDVGAALLASLFMVPAALAFGIDLTAGPTLIFETLPRLFAEFPGGRLFAVIFLGALSLVAFLSSLAALEAVVSGLAEAHPNISRRHWLLIIGGIEMVAIVPSVLHPPLIGTLDMIFGSGVLITGSLLAVLGTGWMLRRASELGPVTAFAIRWIVPAALAAILLGYIVSI